MALSLTAIENLLSGIDRQDLQRLAKKFLSVDTLPMGDIQRWLEQRGGLDAALLLQPGSITTELLPFKFVSGIVDATSGTPSIVNGTGFTITDNGVGDYTINFTPAFADIPAVAVTGRVGAGGIGVIDAKLSAASAVTASAARIAAYRTDTGANIDSEFHFVAIK